MKESLFRSPPRRLAMMLGIMAASAEDLGIIGSPMGRYAVTGKLRDRDAFLFDMRRAHLNRIKRERASGRRRSA